MAIGNVKLQYEDWKNQCSRKRRSLFVPLRKLELMRFIFLSGLLVLSLNLAAQLTSSDLAADREIFETLAAGIYAPSKVDIGKQMTEIGQFFLGTSYVANTLDDSGNEALVINLRGLDCTTFVENVLVLSHLAQEEKLTWGNYPGMLEHVRYRNGVREGYPSRLHYLTDWIRNNTEKGLVKDITKQIHGVAHDKIIDFMGTHPGSYPALGNPANLEAIRNTEQVLSQEPLWILPQSEIAKQEHLLKDGDIIALATNIEGLDVTHTGLAVRLDDNRIHLLHASTVGEVVISEKPLSEYLKGIKSNIGIIVARPLTAN